MDNITNTPTNDPISSSKNSLLNESDTLLNTNIKILNTDTNPLITLSIINPFYLILLGNYINQLYNYQYKNNLDNK